MTSSEKARRAGWRLEHYGLFLALMGAASFGLGLWVLGRTGMRWAPALGVALGLIVGQWWLIQFVVTQLLWNRGGFAP